MLNDVFHNKLQELLFENDFAGYKLVVEFLDAKKAEIVNKLNRPVEDINKLRQYNIEIAFIAKILGSLMGIKENKDKG